jgi:cation:H+ antiporter
VALVAGANLAVDRLVGLARRYGVSDALLGSTVVAVGTSLPEVAAGVTASGGILAGRLDYEVASATVLGANVGSSTLQQTLLVGVLLLGYGRYRPTRSFLWRHYVPMLAGFTLFLALAADGGLSRLDGAALLVTFVAFTYLGVRRRERPLPGLELPSARPRRDAAVALVGLVAVLAGAEAVLEAVELLVANFRLGGSTVGVVTVGVAAALPELSTVLGAVRKRSPAVALGTLVGSNVVNPLLGVGLGAALSTYAVPPVVVRFDLPFKLAVGALVLVPLALGNGELGRRDGVALAFAYVAYVVLRFTFFPGQ